MKSFLSLLLGTALLLTACSTSNLSVADPEILDTHPELEGPILAWQGMVDAAAEEDCAAFLEYMRITLKLTEEVCPAAFEYLEKAPEVNWERTDWSTSGGKAKIYSVEGGSITSFIHNEADDSWRSDQLFWQ